MLRCKKTVPETEFCPDLAEQYVPFPDFEPCGQIKEGGRLHYFRSVRKRMPGGISRNGPTAVCLQATTFAGGVSAGDHVRRRRISAWT